MNVNKLVNSSGFVSADIVNNVSEVSFGSKSNNFSPVIRNINIQQASKMRIDSCTNSPSHIISSTCIRDPSVEGTDSIPVKSCFVPSDTNADIRDVSYRCTDSNSIIDLCTNSSSHIISNTCTRDPSVEGTDSIPVKSCFVSSDTNTGIRDVSYRCTDFNSINPSLDLCTNSSSHIISNTCIRDPSVEGTDSIPVKSCFVSSDTNTGIRDVSYSCTDSNSINPSLSNICIRDISEIGVNNISTGSSPNSSTDFSEIDSDYHGESLNSVSSDNVSVSSSADSLDDSQSTINFSLKEKGGLKCFILTVIVLQISGQS